MSPYLCQLVHHGLNPAIAAHRAVAVLYEAVQTQATMLSYIDVFKALGIGAFLMIGLVVFLKRIPIGHHASAVH